MFPRIDDRRRRARVRVYRFNGAACAHLAVSPAVGIPDGMPFLLDEGGVPVRVVNRWLRSLPTSGAPAPKTWEAYAGDLAAWVRFLRGRSLDVIDDPSALKDALAAYHADRLMGALERRLDDSSWSRATSSIASFYAWVQAEGLIESVPFSYRMTAVRGNDGATRTVRRNLASGRRAKRHVSIRWLERDFLDLFLAVGLAGLAPDGGEDASFGGREAPRNAAMGHLAATSGLRVQEFSNLLIWELPSPPSDTKIPVVPLAVPGVIAKGGRARTTWVSPDALRRVDSYVKLERPLTVGECRWQPAGEALTVSEAGPLGGRVNGRRVRWCHVSLGERRRLVAPDGGPALWALSAAGAPLDDWEYVFRAATARCRRSEPRFPQVTPHMLRHCFAVHTLRWLTRTQLATVAKLMDVAGGDPQWALALRSQDPLLILRDLLGHASVATTEVYLNLVDTARLFADTELGVGEGG
jgi:site-specific recombinase XerD